MTGYDESIHEIHRNPRTSFNRPTVKVHENPSISFNESMVDVHRLASTGQRHMFTEDRIEYEIKYSSDIVGGSCGDMCREIVEESRCYRSVSR